MKKQLLLAFSIIISLSSFSQKFNVSGINYKVTAPNIVEVGTHISFNGDVNIPSEVSYNGSTYVVTNIGDDAFAGCTGVTSLTIPSSVTSIGFRAFKGCTGLTSLTIPNSISIIGLYEEAFYNCTNLTVIIAQSIFPIGLGLDVFGNVDKTISVYVPEGSVASYEAADQWKDFNVKEITSLTFEVADIIYAVTSSNTVEVGKNPNFIGNANIPHEVTKYGITFAVTNISDWAFTNCSVIESLTIPNSITNIGEYGFAFCVNLTSISLGDSITSLGFRAFQGCSSLSSVTIPNSVTEISEGLFLQCSGLISITIPNSITKINDESIALCTNLSSITIPNSVTYIGGDAFNGCSSLSYITVEASTPPQLSYDVFFDVDKTIPLFVPIESIDLYETADQWKDFDIQGQSLTTFTILGITYRVTSLNTVYVDQNPGVSGELNIPNQVSYNNINYSVSSISDSAFFNCTGLISVTLPNSITNIGNKAFSGCTGLTSFTSEAITPPALGTNVFEGINNNGPQIESDATENSIPLYVPQESVDLYKAADQWKDFYVQQIVITDVFEITKKIFNIYPNPANSIINVSSINKNIEGEFQLFNSLGNLVLTKSFINTDQLSINFLIPGVYIYQFNQNGKIEYGKLVIE